MNTLFKLKRGPDNEFILERAGEPDVPNIRVVRAFPWSHPNGFISLRNDENQELVFIEALDDLDEAQRRLILEAVDESALLPTIYRVVRVQPRDKRWVVETDRGQTEIQTQDRQNIHPLSDGRYLINDIYGNAYLLLKLTDLDAKSRQMVQEMI